MSFRPIFPKSRAKRILLIALTFTIVVPLILIARALITLGTVSTYREHWEAQLRQTPPSNVIRVVGLGDSAMQGIGASTPDESVYGRISEHIAARTGRPVYQANISVTGAKVADVLRDQLPQLQKLQPDIIVVSVSGNDANQQVDIKQFERDINTLYAALPKDITIVSDVPGVDHREAYQPILLEAASKHGLTVAPVYENFAPHDDKITSYAGDFFHPSSKGYKYWFNAYRPAVDKLLVSIEKTE
ncbi:hypothetical protein CYG49_00360 [Candidatus Saccharibacteria bacterium]|nr:MAG: hypothetical protein CYG49_00360 [Candidatus Saccharibacteria bacterium]